MTDTTVKPYPQTPAEVAAAVLDAISAAPDAFDMNSWFWQPEDVELGPGDAPSCGTTMCVAGWAAHVTGWTLRDGSWAEKDGEVKLIEDVAFAALGLSNCSPFYGDVNGAFAVLHAIAGR